MYEWQKMDYGKAGSLTHGRDPAKYTWGYFANDTLPESGIGLFFWFESPDELLSFIENVETKALPDKEKAKQEIRQVLKGIDLQRGLTKDLRKQLNNKLGDIEIYWWGKFSDLCSGKSKFGREVINSFFNSLSLDNKPQMVTTRYLPRFIEFCKREFNTKSTRPKRE